MSIIIKNKFKHFSMLDMWSNPLPRWERSWELQFIAHSLRWAGGGAVVSTHALVQITTVFSATPGGLVYVGPRERSETGETEASTDKSWHSSFVVHQLLSLELRVPSWPYSTEPGLGIAGRRCFQFFYHSQWDWFHTHPEYRSLLTSFWVSHKRNSFLC